MRRCRYRGQPKAHLQHVLTAIAVTIALSSRPATENAFSLRPPTAFRPSWTSRGCLGQSPGAPSAPDPDQDPRQGQAPKVTAGLIQRRMRQHRGYGCFRGCGCALSGEGLDPGTQG
ncbi:transposase [Streptomyces sp. NBC_00440]